MEVETTQKNSIDFIKSDFPHLSPISDIFRFHNDLKYLKVLTSWMWQTTDIFSSSSKNANTSMVKPIYMLKRLNL